MSSLVGLSACAPTATPTLVATDALFQARVDGAAARSSVSGGFVHSAPGYTLRYYLDSLPEEVAPASIKLELRNTGDENARILWQESRFTYPSGTVSRIIHQGVAYRTRAEAVAPTTVLPRGRHSDLAVPSRSVGLERGGTRVAPLYSLAHRHPGRFSLSLALEVGGVPQIVRLQWKSRESIYTAR